MQYDKDHSNYDLLDTMNFFVVSAYCRGFGKLENDCIIRRNINNSSKIALKNNFTFMNEYFKEEDSANYYAVRFLDKGITKERNIYVMPEKEIDTENQKGYFLVDYRKYKSLSPRRQDKFNLSDFKLNKTGQKPIKKDKLEVPKCMKSAEATII